MFDFDGTLTTADSFIALLAFAGGRAKMYATLALFSPLLALSKLGLYSGGRVKEKVFSLYFKGMPEGEFRCLCRRFAAAYSGKILNPRTVGILRGTANPVVVTASMAAWVGEFLPGVEVVGTEPQVENGLLTGRFSTPNCNGQEKVRRLMAVRPWLDAAEVVAYGDSPGDLQLLRWAGEAYVVEGGEPRRWDGKGGPAAVLTEQALRFAAVGAAATAIQYAVYIVACAILPRGGWFPSAAMTVGYAASFVFNFIASTRYTFRTKATAAKGGRFALAHAANYSMQIALLNAFLWLGTPGWLAPLPVFCVCVPANFLLVRKALR